MPVAICTVLNSWWWTERPSETGTNSFQNRLNFYTPVHQVGFTTETLQIVSDIHARYSTTVTCILFTYLHIHMHGPVLVMTTQVTYSRIIQARLHKQTCRGKKLLLQILSSCLVALVTHHVKRICPIILSPAASLPVPYFCTVPHKLHGFRKNILTALHVCIEFLCNVFLKHFSSSEVSMSLCTAPLIFVRS